jgi:hypothetical protein
MYNFLDMESLFATLAYNCSWCPHSLLCPHDKGILFCKKLSFKTLIMIIYFFSQTSHLNPHVSHQIGVLKNVSNIYSIHTTLISSHCGRVELNRFNDSL